MPVDVRALGVDLLAGGVDQVAVRRPGTGYLYVSPTLAPRLRPALTGWFAHERPFDFDSGPMRWDDGRAALLDRHARHPSHLAARPGYRDHRADRRGRDPREVAAPDRSA